MLCLLVGVIPVDASQINQKSLIKLSSHKLEDSVNWILKGNNTGRIRLNGVFAINDQKLFIYGSINVAPGDVRSLLLISKDGGKTWVETMRPVSVSSVEALVFNNDGLTGMAVVMWTLGGLGKSKAYYSTDGGKTWLLKGQIPQIEDQYCQPLDLFTMNKSTFILRVNCQDEDSGKEYYLITSNSGKSWKRYHQRTETKTFYDKEKNCYLSIKQDSCWSVIEKDDHWIVTDQFNSKDKKPIYIESTVQIKGTKYQIIKEEVR